MTSKFNPNSPAFIPTKQTNLQLLPNLTPSLQQTKQQKSVSNMSSQATPVSLNPRHPQKKGSRQRELKLIRDQRKNQVNLNDDHFGLDFEDEVIMTGNLKTRGRRGQISINHLLDFALPSRDLESDFLSKSYQPVRFRRRSDNNDKVHLQASEFINANYRFVVDYRSNYYGQVLDPNLVLHDKSILRVIVPKSHNCPICLSDDIVAPRMISCGHIFCHTCLLSFLDSESIKKKDAPPKRYKECPLCALPVRPHEIKPVLINGIDERFEIPKNGHDIVMKLMAKPFDNILPIPHSLNLNHKKIGDIPWYSDTELYPYARILKGGLKYIVNCYENDKLEILKQHEEDKLLYNNDDKYVKKAIQEIDEKVEEFKNSFENIYDEPNALVNSMDNLSITKNNSGLNDLNCYFFYQTSFFTTTRYFLSPLDIKVLLKVFGSYSNFPTTLLVKVDNVSYGQMVTETTLKRYKYLGHLPLGTDFAFIEINWKHMDIPSEAIHEYAKELNDRRRKNLSKLKKENQAKKNYENEQELRALEFFKTENDGWGIYDFKSEQEVFDTPSLVSETDTPSPIIDSSDQTEHVSRPSGITTVWGTKIPKPENSVIGKEDYENDWDTEEMIKKAKEEEQKNGKNGKKGRKKKLLLLSSTYGRGGF